MSDQQLQPAPAPTDLVERMVSASAAAIRDQRPDFERDPSSLCGLTIEVVIRRDGSLGDVLVYTERRKTAGALLARHTRNEETA